MVHFFLRIIEDEAKRQQKPGFDILIDEWGTSGKCRPTIHDLMQLFISVDLYQAADYLSMDVLKLGSVPRPQDGPSAPVPVVSSEFFATVQTESIPPFLEATNPHLNCIATEQEESEIEQFDTTIPHLLYSELEHITDNFNLVPVAQKGRKLGAGAFGTVFLGQLPEHPLQEDSFMVRIFQKMKVSLQSKVAVKRLSTEKVCTNFKRIQRTFYNFKIYLRISALALKNTESSNYLWNNFRNPST